MKISSLRSLFHTKLAPLYEEREIDAIFFIYIEDKFNIKKHSYYLNPKSEVCGMRSYGLTVLRSYGLLGYEVRNDIEALAKGSPIQYVTGKTTFCELKLAVNSSVLIPRPETEELVTLILKNSYGLTVLRSYGLKILDIGTGSGAIATALAKKIENAEVWATDISEDALKIAKENAETHDVKITFLHHDILNDGISVLPDNLDIIVSNPPYIPLHEQSGLHKNVVNYEPNTALFVPDENPLLFYNVIAETAKKILRRGGVLYFETHEKFHSELSAMLIEFDFKEITLWNDLNGKPRFSSCKKL